MSRLLLVRHGESLWNSERRIQGHQDSGLSPTGRLQTERLADRLKGRSFGALYSSSSQRAKESAEILSAAVGLPVHLRDDLREIRLGRWEGKTVQEIEEEDGDLYQRWLTRPLEATPPGGEGLVPFQKRIVTALEGIRDAHPEQDVLIVTHAGAIRAYVSFILDLDLNRIFTLKIDNTALSEVLFAKGVPTLSLFNDTCHLLSLDKSIDRPKELSIPVF
ncbi:MAG: histidine phosphatase family protein [candidate division NC10 bacterium]|nr:histidine phosphatase family protein [candidate division NC10 bacterium]